MTGTEQSNEDPERIGGVVTVLVSVPQQVAIIAPVVRELEKLGFRSTVLTLDAWYKQGAVTAARAEGLDASEILPDRPVSEQRFYRRPTIAIWRDVFRARAPMSRALRDTRLLVVANDSGLLEKLAIKTVRRRGVTTALVQDGRLSAKRPPPDTVRAAVARMTRRLVSPVLRALGVGFLAASRYGQGGATLAFATGAEGASILRRADPTRPVIVAGQPKYDRLAAYPHGGDPSGSVTMFTSPFAADGFGDPIQIAQEAFAAGLKQALMQAGVQFRVKPHPREGAAGYVRLLGSDSVTADSPADLITTSRAVVLGISSVIEEASLLGCPVFVVGTVVHGSRFEELLPDVVAYPRYDDASRMAEAILGLDDPKRRTETLKAQRRVIEDDVAFDPTKPAAAVIAQRLAQEMQVTRR